MHDAWKRRKKHEMQVQGRKRKEIKEHAQEHVNSAGAMEAWKRRKEKEVSHEQMPEGKKKEHENSLEAMEAWNRRKDLMMMAPQKKRKRIEHEHVNSTSAMQAWKRRRKSESL